MEPAMYFPNKQYHTSLSPFLISSSIRYNSLASSSLLNRSIAFTNDTRYRSCSTRFVKDRVEVGIENDGNREPEEDSKNTETIVSACLVGLITGIGVVLFNNGVHVIRDYFWDGIPYRGASWLREEPFESSWLRVICAPACGGLIVSFLNVIREEVDSVDNDDDDNDDAWLDRVKAVLRPLLKTVAACVTLGTGNSLGPEGPSVEIGTSVAKGVNNLFGKSPRTRLSLLASGSAAGLASGFNAAVAGCFFAVESVLWPSPADSSVSLTNTTSMVILGAVIAAVVSQVGLGTEPAFKIPEYDFRSIGEIPLYLLLGMICGLVSVALTRCTSYMLGAVDNVHKTAGVPRAVFPVLGGLTTGIIALMYPEILYWGFQNVDILLESRPFVKGLSADLLLQLVGVKIVATSLCRASGLVGGYYAPSLFIGAATGMAYGKFINLAVEQLNPAIHLSILEVASPQAYGLVGMAATLAGVCQVPLTAVLLLFELTRDYYIVLPLLGAVGMSSWITSGLTKRRDAKESKDVKERSSRNTAPLPQTSSSDLVELSSSYNEESYENNLCELESSLCVEDTNSQTKEFKNIFVSEAMRTRYVTIFMSTLLTEAVALMLEEKQSCAIIVDTDNILVGLLTLADIQDFSKITTKKNAGAKKLLVSEMCSLLGENCRVPWTATPNMDLVSAQMVMNKVGVSHIPVVLEKDKGNRPQPVGLLDRESIGLTYRVLAAREYLE